MSIWVSLKRRVWNWRLGFVAYHSAGKVGEFIWDNELHAANKFVTRHIWYLHNQAWSWAEFLAAFGFLYVTLEQSSVQSELLSYNGLRHALQKKLRLVNMPHSISDFANLARFIRTTDRLCTRSFIICTHALPFQSLMQTLRALLLQPLFLPCSHKGMVIVTLTQRWPKKCHSGEDSTSYMRFTVPSPWFCKLWNIAFSPVCDITTSGAAHWKVISLPLEMEDEQNVSTIIARFTHNSCVTGR